MDARARKVLVTAGEIVVEIMATQVGQSFRAPGPLVGPFPSGAPAIFIDQAGRLGQPCGMIAAIAPKASRSLAQSTVAPATSPAAIQAAAASKPTRSKSQSRTSGTAIRLGSQPRSRIAAP